MTTPRIPTLAHGIADYVTAATLISMPWLLGTENKTSADSLLPIAAGAGVLGMSLATDYELGVAPVIDMPTHLAMDLLTGIALTASPLFLREKSTRIALLGIGLMSIAFGLMTEVRTSKVKEVSQGDDTQHTLPPSTVDYVAEQISRHG